MSTFFCRSSCSSLRKYIFSRRNLLIKNLDKYETGCTHINTTNKIVLRYFLVKACLHGRGLPQVGEVTRLAEVDQKPAFTYNITTPGCWVKFLAMLSHL